MGVFPFSLINSSSRCALSLGCRGRHLPAAAAAPSRSRFSQPFCTEATSQPRKYTLTSRYGSLRARRNRKSSTVDFVRSGFCRTLGATHKNETKRPSFVCVALWCDDDEKKKKVERRKFLLVCPCTPCPPLTLLFLQCDSVTQLLLLLLRSLLPFALCVMFTHTFARSTLIPLTRLL